MDRRNNRSHLSSFDLSREVKAERLLRDMKPICGVANGIEAIENPYDAANKALKYAKRFGVSSLLVELEAEVQGATSSDPRFRGLENEVAMAVEKAPNVKLRCFTAGCLNEAISSSHALQKGGALKYLSDDNGRVYQTKLTPFTKGDALKDLSIKSASTFPGYCKACEVGKFSASENSGAKLTKNLMLPLIWRALCFIQFRRAQELKVRGLIVSKPTLYTLTSEHSDPATGLSSMLHFKNVMYSYRMAKRWVQSLERAIESGSHNISMIAMEMPDITFVGAGLIPIPISFDGSLDAQLFRFEKEISSIAYTTVIVESVPHLIFAFRKTDGRAKAFCKEMITMSPDLLSAYMPEIIIGGSDTVFVSKHFWDSQATLADKAIIERSQVMGFPEMTFPPGERMSCVSVGRRSFIL